MIQIPLIGLYSSVMGCGKSEITKVLVEDHGYVNVKFAGTLKSMLTPLLVTLGIPPQDTHRYTEGPEKETILPVIGVSTRRLMQTLGTDWGRNIIKSTIWVDVTWAHISRLLSDGWKVVVDDVRFPNEFDVLKQHGGHLVKVIRPTAKLTAAHLSEGLLEGKEFNSLVMNEGSLEELHGKAQWLARLVSNPSRSNQLSNTD